MADTASLTGFYGDDGIMASCSLRKFVLTGRPLDTALIRDVTLEMFSTSWAARAASIRMSP